MGLSDSLSNTLLGGRCDRGCCFKCDVNHVFVIVTPARFGVRQGARSRCVQYPL